MAFVTCPTCGAEIPKNETICPSCGTAIQTADETELHQHDTQRSRIGRIFIIVTVVLVVMIAIGVLLR